MRCCPDWILTAATATTGTTMLRAVTVLEKVLDTSTTTDIQSLLSEVGWAILGIDGGAAGPLLGTFFLSMAEAAAGREALDAPNLANLFEAGLAGVQKQTQARVGDKTMLDALLPAVEAARRAVEAGEDIPGLLRQSAEAARRGAEATQSLQAKFGKARNAGVKSIGAQDPGATSISLLFRGFYEGSTGSA